jgi:hypothetical protein
MLALIQATTRLRHRWQIHRQCQQHRWPSNIFPEICNDCGDTSVKSATAFNDTIDKLSLVSSTSVVNNTGRQQHRWSSTWVVNNTSSQQQRRSSTPVVNNSVGQQHRWLTTTVDHQHLWSTTPVVNNTGGQQLYIVVDKDNSNRLPEIEIAQSIYSCKLLPNKKYEKK